MGPHPTPPHPNPTPPLFPEPYHWILGSMLHIYATYATAGAGPGAKVHPGAGAGAGGWGWGLGLGAGGQRDVSPYKRWDFQGRRPNLRTDQRFENSCTSVNHPALRSRQAPTSDNGPALRSRQAPTSDNNPTLRSRQAPTSDDHPALRSRQPPTYVCPTIGSKGATATSVKRRQRALGAGAGE